MLAFPPLLLALTEEELGHSHSFTDALPHLGGMLMVIVTLTVLWGLCSLTAKLVNLLTPSAVKHPMPATAKPPAPETTASPVVSASPATGLDPQLVAVIAAAVATCAGKNRRIISIQPQGTAWERAGRQSVLSSHRIR